MALADLQGYKWDLSDEDAQELGRRSICAAGHRDAYSGNTINLYHVRENGWEFIGESRGLERDIPADFRQLRPQRAVVQVRRGEEEQRQVEEGGAGIPGRAYRCRVEVETVYAYDRSIASLSHSCSHAPACTQINCPLIALRRREVS